MEMKANERMAAVRDEAKAMLPALENAVKVGTGEYLLVTATGVAKVTISATKDAEFDVDAAAEAYAADLAEKAEKAAVKAAEKAAKDAAKAAKA